MKGRRKTIERKGKLEKNTEKKEECGKTRD